ncbi:MAG TPA: c-type cytochrome [Terriglobales bacterium]|nr:c-type cytochrome [Terriglobales bacterium]
MVRLHSWLIAGSILGMLLLGAGQAAAQNLNGKELYRNNCKTCHDAGSPYRQYTPMTLTQEQWRIFFQKKLVHAHQNAVHPKTGEKFKMLSPEQIKSIQRFVIDHAADSEQPATCG